MKKIVSILILGFFVSCGQSKNDTQEMSLTDEEIKQLELIDSLATEIDSTSLDLLQDAEDSDQKIDALLDDI